MLYAVVISAAIPIQNLPTHHHHEEDLQWNSQHDLLTSLDWKVLFRPLEKEMNDFAVLLEKLRETRQISKKQLALSAGLSAGYVSLLTLGERDAPSKETVADLATALELDEKESRPLFEAAGSPASAAFSKAPPQTLPMGTPSTPT